MGPKRTAQENVLREVLRISEAQKALFAENRLDELLEGQRKREMLLSSLDEEVDYKQDPYCSIIGRIISNDRVLSLGIESMRDEVGARMKKIKSGVRAMKAYGAS